MRVRRVQYKITPGRIDENEALVRAVFKQLHETAPEGLQYASLRADDGTFMHIVCAEDDEAESLTELPAFKQFQSGIRERFAEPSQAIEFKLVGNYGLFEER